MAAEGRSYLSLAEARRKCQEKHSCFTQIETTEHMILSPSYLGRLREGINDELSKKLMKFCDELQGVMVAYDKIQLLQRHGSIMEDSPFIHFDIKVNYIVFQPQIGSELIGVVNNFGYGHIGCLVHGCFNASITRPVTQNGHFTENLKLGSSFKFRVVGIDSLNGVLLINGAFDDGKLRKSKSKESVRIEDVQRNDGTITSNTGIQSSQKSMKHKLIKLEEIDEPVPKKKRKLLNGDASREEKMSTSKNNNIDKDLQVKSKSENHIMTTANGSGKRAKEKKNNQTL